jgi:hypothetical protein
MRHVWSLLSGIAVTAAIMALFAVDLSGYDRWWILARLVGAGLLLGLVASLRTSPVGPIVAGLLMLTPVVLAFTAPSLYGDVFLQPDFVTVGGTRAGLIVLDTAGEILAVAGATMIVAVVSRQRWLSWPKPVDALVDNGPADDTLQYSAGAHDGTTEQLWIQPR